MKTILIADDNKQLVSVLSEYSKKEGYKVFKAYDGEEALEIFKKEKIDLALLDVMMPKKYGYQVCSEIRSKSNIPIIMITAKGEDFEKIMGLDMGADDYIVKPFSPGEVMARIRAIMRRLNEVPQSSKNENLLYDNLKISLDQLKVTIDCIIIELTKTEIDLLWLMANNRNRVFTRDNILDFVWGEDFFGDIRTIDSHIKRLRSKLSKVEHPNWNIKTVWGTGYTFETKI